MSTKQKKKAAPSRRLGVENSVNRNRLVEAAAALLREQGNAALSARQVAGKAGLKPQLVYYYFHTMDDLVTAVVQQVNQNRLERFQRALAARQPLQALWEMNSDPSGANLSSALISLAVHREAVRAEIAHNAEQFRRLQIEAVERLFREQGVDPQLYPAAGIVMIVASLARGIVSESALGVSVGHAEALKIVERAIAQFKPGPRAALRES
jgi:TetR/AcrR family transcriptional regulator